MHTKFKKYCISRHAQRDAVKYRHHSLATRIHIVFVLAWLTKNTAHYCSAHTNFAWLQLRILANQVNPFFIESVIKVVAFWRTIFKIKKALVYLSLDQIYDIMRLTTVALNKLELFAPVEKKNKLNKERQQRNICLCSGTGWTDLKTTVHLSSRISSASMTSRRRESGSSSPP
jgi:hypothetical protein